MAIDLRFSLGKSLNGLPMVEFYAVVTHWDGHQSSYRAGWVYARDFAPVDLSEVLQRLQCHWATYWRGRDASILSVAHDATLDAGILSA